MPADLWSFTLDFYARPGVESACLRLQDQGADVCMLMCGAWLGLRGIGFSPSRADEIAYIALPWQMQVISPLRALRQQWRTAAAEDTGLAVLREQVKTTELAAERQLLERLQVLSQDWQVDHEANAGLWLEALAGDIASQDRNALQVLRAAVNDITGEA